MWRNSFLFLMFIILISCEESSCPPFPTLTATGLKESYHLGDTIFAKICLSDTSYLFPTHRDDNFRHRIAPIYKLYGLDTTISNKKDTAIFKGLANEDFLKGKGLFRVDVTFPHPKNGDVTISHYFVYNIKK